MTRTIPPLDSLHRGIDVSDHQPPVDWPTVAASGVTFAVVKATEGATWRGRKFADHWSGARAAGLRVGAYHWFKPATSTPEEQAANFLEVYRSVEGWAELPLALDVEEFNPADRISSSGLVRRVLACAAIVEREVGVAPLIYTYSAFARAHFFSPEAEKLAKYPLWLADYRRTPVVPPPWSDWTVLQTTGRGRCPGVRGNVDLNVAKSSVFLAPQP